MGGKGGGSAPNADPQIGQAALMQAQTGQDWLDFAKQQFDEGNVRQAAMDDLTTKVTNQQYGIAQQQADWSAQDRQRYEDTFVPVEDQYVKDATSYATPEKQAEMAAEAKADVLNNAASAQQQNARQMASMGVNPNSGRFAGIDRATSTATGLAAADAQNTARQAVRDKGLALEADVANMGRGLPSQSAQAAGTSTNAGQAAVGSTAAANANFYQNNATMTNGYQGAMAGYAGQGQTLNSLYNTQAGIYSTQQQAAATSSAGLGSAVGSGIGLAAVMI